MAERFAGRASGGIMLLAFIAFVIRVSVQVLQEFFVTVTKKVARPLPAEEAKVRIRELKTWSVFAPSADDVESICTLRPGSGSGTR